MKVLITGIAGFAGSHLAELLLGGGDEVSGVVMPGESRRNLDSFKSEIRLFEADVRDAEGIRKSVVQANPEEIYHLAAITFIPDAISDPRATFETNLLGTMNIFEAAKELGAAPRILYVGSSDEYGLVKKNELPITEDNPLRPVNPYSVSKVSASLLAYQYGLSGQFHTVRVRPFNHTGPRQSPRFVCPDFARQIVEVEKGNARQIHVGNLQPKRDFTDVRDVARAYRDILRGGESCEAYNICSGKSVAIEKVLSMLLEVSGQSLEIVERSERVRKSEVEEVCGDNGKIESAIGWKPSIPLEKTFKDMVAYWRETGQ